VTDGEATMAKPAVVIALLFGCAVQACSQAGDAVRARDAEDVRAAAGACDPKHDPRCKPLDERRDAVKPAVPPVPDSPIRAKCEQLPTQVERDTCTNRKESTG